MGGGALWGRPLSAYKVELYWVIFRGEWPIGFLAKGGGGETPPKQASRKPCI